MVRIVVPDFKINETKVTKNNFNVLSRSSALLLIFIKPLINQPPKNRIANTCNPIFD
jgi:hypothetical protein